MSGNLSRASVESLVIGKLTFVRWAVVGGVIAAVGAAGAATKLKKPAAGNACLCTPDSQAPNDLTAAIDPTAAPSFASRGVTTPAGSSSTAGPLTAALSGTAAEYHGGAGSAAGNSGNGKGVGFGAGGRFMGARSASNSGRSATLGGLWRLMSLSRRVPAREAAAIRASLKAPKAAKAPKPGRSGAAKPGAGPSTTAPVASDDLFAEQTTTIPDLLAGGGAPVIGNPGSSRGAGDPSSLAATPEPGPLFLVGAGLLAIASLLRRRLTA